MVADSGPASVVKTSAVGRDPQVISKEVVPVSSIGDDGTGRIGHALGSGDRGEDLDVGF